MARRSTVNKTGFANKEGINHKEAWVCFPCLNCGATVKANIAYFGRSNGKLRLVMS